MSAAAAIIGAMISQQMRRNSTTYIHGFVAESWDESLARWIFKTYPETALSDQELMTYYMDVLFEIIRVLGHEGLLSDAELSRASRNLRYLTKAGFKLEWLRSRLEMAYLERKKRDARIVELKQELKKLEGAMSRLKAELKNEKAKLNPRCSFRNFFCLKTA